MNRTQRTIQSCFALVLTLTLLLGPAAGLAQAQTDPLADDPTHVGAAISCHAGDCRLNIDLGELEINNVDLSQAPLNLSVPKGRLDFLREGWRSRSTTRWP